MTAVDELEELDGELDVAQPARAELDLPVAPGPGLGRGLDPGLHAPHGRNRLRVESLGVHLASASARNRSASSASPATGRSLISACSSHGWAQRSQ